MLINISYFLYYLFYNDQFDFYQQLFVVDYRIRRSLNVVDVARELCEK